MARAISAKLIEDTARELTARAAIDIPADYRDGVRRARDIERNKLARFVLTEMLANWELATADRRPMCADTGLPRYYVRAGNEAQVEGGFVAMERALRRATAEATATIPLRPNRVHPLTRADHNNNVGVHAPEVTYAFEPGGDWIDVTTVHTGAGARRDVVGCCDPQPAGCLAHGWEADRHAQLLPFIAAGDRPHPPRRPRRVAKRSPVVHRLLATGGHRGSAGPQRLGDAAM